jgi:hypothetical protein
VPSCARRGASSSIDSQAVPGDAVTVRLKPALPASGRPPGFGRVANPHLPAPDVGAP